jgi:hypothetical protein
MALVRKNRWIRLVLAIVLVGGFSFGTQAYESRFDACFVECGDCSIGTFGCDWCEEHPAECAIEFGSCELIVCDCPSGCIIIES